MSTYQVVRTTTDKLQLELNRPGPHILVSVHHIGGRDWVVITQGGELVPRAEPVPVDMSAGVELISDAMDKIRAKREREQGR